MQLETAPSEIFLFESVVDVGTEYRRSKSEIDTALGVSLKTRHPAWRESIDAYQRGLSRNTRMRPDLLLRNRFPIAIETEYVSSYSIEVAICPLLGYACRDGGSVIQAVIVCQVPLALRKVNGSLRSAIERASYRYCVYQLENDIASRWPKEGWLAGTVNDLADCLELVSVSERLLQDSAELLSDVVQDSAGVVLENCFSQSNLCSKLGEIFRQNPSEQTVRMAITILANAMVFHLSIQQTYDLPDFEDWKETGRKILPAKVIDCWYYILKEINYWPIFRLAIDVLRCLGASISMEVLKRLELAAINLLDVGVTSLHDLSGRILQQLISDRKFLATFYTLPSSAALLAECAIARMNVNWADAERYTSLRIADFASGTGTLITAGYQALLRGLHRVCQDGAEVHGSMMANSLIAMDIMPAATHLTASQLSSTNPSVTFANTCVYTMPYGKSGTDENHPISIGSLDLLTAERSSSLFGTGTTQLLGVKDDEEIIAAEIRKGSLDLVIINPPFTRPTNHELSTVPIPSFAGFQTSVDEQRTMAQVLKRARRHLERSVGDGKAGLASDFVDLAHVKLKAGGILALVLPFTVLRGSSWKKFRELLQDEYRDIVIISIASAGSVKRAFSTDTGMAEALIIATKAKNGVTSPVDHDVLYVNLWSRPSTNFEAVEIAKTIARLTRSEQYGSFNLGATSVGSYFRGTIDDTGPGGVRSTDISRALCRVSESKFTFPRYPKSLRIPLVCLRELGKVGPVDRLIGQVDSAIPRKRGIFKVEPIDGVPNYPILWQHDARRETSLLVQPNSQGVVRDGRKQDALRMWETATRLHLNRDFTVNSQPLCACLTPEPVLGGVAWPSFMVAAPNFEEVLALWLNTTIGMSLHWWRGSRQQQGRSRLTVSALPEMFVLDVRELSDSQIQQCQEFVQTMKLKKLLPANEAYRDETRMELDRCFEAAS